MNQFKNLINNTWVTSEDVEDNVNPSNTADILGRAYNATPTQVGEAVEAARAALITWANSSAQMRYDAFTKIGREISARLDELATQLSREQGKTKRESLSDWTRAAEAFNCIGAQCLRPMNLGLQSNRVGMKIEMTRLPVGVVGVISHWTSPVALPMWKIASALAYGNSVVFNATQHAPSSACAIADIINRSGIPPGVFNLVIGSDARDQLKNYQELDALSIIGSCLDCAGPPSISQEYHYKFQADGGRNLQVVLDDADLEQAVELSIQNAFHASAHHGTETGGIIATQGIYARFSERLKVRVAQIKVGDALAAGTALGPVVSTQKLEEYLREVEVAKHFGAKIATGGVRVTCHTGSGTRGNFMAPTLLTDLASLTCESTRVFGPVVKVNRVRNYDEALALVNETPFVMATGITTSSLKHAKHFGCNANPGIVMINLPMTDADYAPVAHYRNSLGFLTKLKTTYAPA